MLDKYTINHIQCQSILEQSPPELKLILCLLTDQTTEIQCTDLIAQVDWEQLLQLIVRHRLVDQIYSALQDQPGISANFMLRLKNLNSQLKLTSLSLTAEAIRIARRFEHEGLRFILVKGIALAVNLYGGSDKRQCKDIDVWLSRADLDRAEVVLHQLGYVTTRPNYKLVGFKREHYLTHGHEVALFNESRKVEIELHFKLESAGSDFLSFEEVQTQSFSVNKQQFCTLEDNYHVLYLMLHGAKHAWGRLRWLNDIALYICQDKCDLAVVHALSLELKCEHIFMQSLWLLRAIYHIKNPKLERLLTTIDERALKLAKLAQQFIAADFIFTGEGHVFKSSFIKYRYYQIILNNNAKRLSALWDILFNLECVFSVIKLPRYCSFGYYLLHPLVFPFYALKSRIIHRQKK